MKFQFTKLFFALSVIGFATVSYAQAPESTTGFFPAINNYGMNALNSIHGWHVNGGGFYNRFSNNGTNYAEGFVYNTTAYTRNVYNVNTGNHFGWNAGIGYYIDCADTDFNFSYFSFNTVDSSNVAALNLYPVTSAVTLTSGGTQGQARFSFNSATLTAAHQIRLSPFFSLYYYGGLSYAHFSKNLTAYSEGGGDRYLITGGSSFNGFGPTFGIDGETYPFYYCEYPNFSISGGVQSTLLYGNDKGYARDRDITTGIVYNTNLPTSNIVAPVLATALAINYLFPINGLGLKATLGYQDTILFGVARASGAYLVSETNASFQGFYFNFTLRF